MTEMGIFNACIRTVLFFSSVILVTTVTSIILVTTVATTGRLFIIHYLSFSLCNFILIVNPSFYSPFPEVQTD